ncbi:hypothetical protein SDC9_129037 [bioreactor metagenome]|uniref:Uncharacterized protein n=1 Tax=bioreactor metagenome TaxID=1076179 RepID=A0A645CYJ1_9ZZZZ
MLGKFPERPVKHDLFGGMLRYASSKIVDNDDAGTPAEECEAVGRCLKPAFHRHIGVCADEYVLRIRQAGHEYRHISELASIGIADGQLLAGPIKLSNVSGDVSPDDGNIVGIAPDMVFLAEARVLVGALIGFNRLDDVFFPQNGHLHGSVARHFVVDLFVVDGRVELDLLRLSSYQLIRFGVGKILNILPSNIALLRELHDVLHRRSGAAASVCSFLQTQTAGTMAEHIAVANTTH